MRQLPDWSAPVETVTRQAQADGVAEPASDATLATRIAAYVWEPRYRPYRLLL